LYLDEHIERSTSLYNSDIKTDSGESVKDYHKGCMNALAEVKGYMIRGKNYGIPI